MRKAEVELQNPLTPRPGSLTIVLTIGQRNLIAYCPVADVDPMMAAIERRLRLTDRREDRMSQMALRVMIIDRMRAAEPLAAWEDWAACAALWLFLHHHGGHGRTRAALDALDVERMGGFLTIQVGSDPKAHPGTSWAMTLDRELRDRSAVLASLQPGTVLSITSDGQERRSVMVDDAT